MLNFDWILFIHLHLNFFYVKLRICIWFYLNFLGRARPGSRDYVTYSPTAASLFSFLVPQYRLYVYGRKLYRRTVRIIRRSIQAFVFVLQYYFEPCCEFQSFSSATAGDDQWNFWRSEGMLLTMTIALSICVWIFQDLSNV